MKKITFILTIFFIVIVTAASGQVKDIRAELYIEGRVDEISVAPDEKIWLVTALGQLYYTNSIDSNWHYAEPLFNSDDESILDSPIFQRISFFNKDTAIMTGYISAVKKQFAKNGLYRTINGGQTWELLEFCGDSWIYDVFTDSIGNAWMGGSSGDIYFSGDFGYHWKKLNSPYNSSSRVNSIFMINPTTGVSGALHNFIYTTTDNWKSSRKVMTPYDQKKYESTGDYSDDRIRKILFWKDYIVVNQNGHIFWTDKEVIEWKPFSINIEDFALDRESQRLIAVTDSMQIISFSSPYEFQRLTSKRLSDYPLDIKVVNHSLYVVTGSYGYAIYKVNESGLTFSIPCTYERAIPEPQTVTKGTNLSWGAEGKQLYLSENSDQIWYREKMLGFSVSDIKLLSDSIAILWDGMGSNYLYSLKDHEAKIYFHQRPLENFLASPVKEFVVLSGSQGCFHQRENAVQYEKENDSTFATSTWVIKDYSDIDSSTFKNKVSAFSLSNVLTEINENPYAMPSLQDFQITETDIKNYLSLVDMKLKSSKRYEKNKNEKKEFYYSVPSRLDTLNKGIVPAILNMQEESWSTTSSWFAIQFVNQNNDTLTISRTFYLWTLPFNLPWNFNYQGQHFSCYSLGFSRFINECIPEEFMDKKVFDNSAMIMAIADLLWNRSH